MTSPDPRDSAKKSDAFATHDPAAKPSTPAPPVTARSKSAPRTFRLWHISDIHLAPDRSPGDAEAKSRPLIGSPQSFEADWSEPLCNHGIAEPVDVLVFSGDFIDKPAVIRAEEKEGLKEVVSDTRSSFAMAIGTGLLGLVGDRGAADALARLLLRKMYGRSRSKLGSAPHKTVGTTPPATLPPKQRAFLRAQAFVKQVANAHGLLDKLGTHVIVCPGNHDATWPDQDKGEKGPSFEEFDSVFSEFLRPRIDRPFLLSDELGIAAVVLNTAWLGGAKFAHGGKTFQTHEDAGCFDQKEFKKAYQVLAENWSGKANSQLPAKFAGIVIAHHPPSVIPTPTTEIKPFETTIGAAQAKQWLYDVGMRVFLHGHKHVSVAQREVVYKPSAADPSMVAVLGTSALLGSGGSTPGFNVIACAVSPICGGVWLQITPHVFMDFIPKQEGTVRIALPARTRTPARLTRSIERINEFGDCRTDTTWHDVAVPASDHSIQGWKKAGNSLSRTFERRLLAPECHAGEPLARELVPGARVGISKVSSNDGGEYTWEINIDALPGTKSVSVFERTNWAGGYALSVTHQKRLGKTSQAVPDLEIGWEYFIHMLREPSERLELFVRLPFPTNEDLDVVLRTYVEDENGKYQPAPYYLAFSNYLIEKALYAKRIRVAITKPVTGVAYSVHWQLPSLTQAEAKLGEEGRSQRNAAEREAEGLRDAMVRLDEKRRVRAQEALRSTLMPVFTELLKNEPLVTIDDIEWALFVPDQKIWPLGASTPAPVRLRPMLASFPPADKRWEQSWKPGYGIAGRSYAVGQNVLYAPSQTSSTHSWDDITMNYYLSIEGSEDHTVLYATPLVHPKRADVYWGCLCIGSYKEHARLDFRAPRSDVPQMQLGLYLINQLVDFSSNFWLSITGHRFGT